ncbi:RsmB/NOP family class I SAM-dependent RNA methyltransferase [Aestuariicoccus sp. MJ-SS9]|uniref:RsmB/NOP family class I SAM-dependent RNA methyltransferase n=1 Tax=Aestuariicoccus sp. MJ-SS9 TaxID=3079855 RepID=UPI00290F9BF8|nr:RsmB/NOP family class I SAM-dependent RNA methyltransferase [Aestuariicoccus sp. MJ-SS9]MDU8911343.1 RsmB/NOP family class I SAM-dependent RNA methyltransferase [Aestuariicoccus sp. MJ-SS9]
MARSAPTARQVAVQMLDQVLGQGRLISELSGLPSLAALAPAERAAALRLTNETLRGLERADRVLKPFLKKPPPLTVTNVLRLATVELCTGGAAHGVVNEAVRLVAEGRKTAGMKGLVNAVLRRVADKGPGQWAVLRVPRLPDWLRGPLVEAWGREPVMAMEAAHFAGAPLDLTAKGDPAAVARAVGGALLPTGSVRLAAGAQVTALPGYDAGDWWVQDAAAALPARLLGDVRGLKVLDMCAAPGGKTMQLAAAGAEVTALDLSAARLVRVEENLARTGLTATCVEGDALTHEGRYHAILLDAPCSATGTIRRHPDLPHARTGDGISELIGQQAAMIDHALSLLAPGGRLVFCTCSLIPDEGEVQVTEALARHPGLTVQPVKAPWIEDAWRSAEGGLRLRPDFWAERGGMDGFYMAVLGPSG